MEEKFNSVSFKASLNQNFGSSASGAKPNDYARLANEVDKALKEMEERIYRSLNERLEEHRHTIYSLERKISESKPTSLNHSFSRER